MNRREQEPLNAGLEPDENGEAMIREQISDAYAAGTSDGIIQRDDGETMDVSNNKD